MSDETRVRCPCGEDHTGSLFWPVVRHLIEDYGETIRVTLAGQTYFVPRTWIAFHGLQASQLADLATQYGWTTHTQEKETGT